MSESSTTRDAIERHDAGYQSLRRFITRTPPSPPGKSLTERERVEAHRVAKEAAAKQAAELRRQVALAKQQADLAEMDRIDAFGTRVKNELGAARNSVRRAVEAFDLDAAIVAAERVASLELVFEETKRHGDRFGKLHRGFDFYRVGGMGRV